MNTRSKNKGIKQTQGCLCNFVFSLSQILSLFENRQNTWQLLFLPDLLLRPIRKRVAGNRTANCQPTRSLSLHNKLGLGSGCVIWVGLVNVKSPSKTCSTPKINLQNKSQAHSGRGNGYTLISGLVLLSGRPRPQS